MAGVKGRSGSGGARPGAGRPIRKISIKPGDVLYIRETDKDGMITLPEKSTVAEVTRTTITIILDNGLTLTMRR